MSSPEQSLSDLLVALFDGNELRQLLLAVDPRLDAKLSWQGALAQTAFEAVKLLGRHNLIDYAFFERLEAERERRVDEIRAVRRQLVSEVLETGAAWAGGRFTLLERLGQGGFVEAWKAVDTRTAEYVTLRILHTYHGEDPRRRQRFQRGAQALRGLQHPAIAGLREADVKEGPWLYCVMEHVEGCDLGTLVARGEAPAPLLLEIVCQIGEALAHVHARGLVHRDVTPGNILVARHGGGAKLIDFDLVSGPNAARLTGTMPLGTLPFVAPEILAGEEATAAADVYALAATTLFVLTRGLQPSGLHQQPDTLLRQFPAGSAFRKLLSAGLQLDPKRRTSSALEFSRELRALASSHSTTGTRMVWVTDTVQTGSRIPPVPEFDDDGMLRIWAPAPDVLPTALEAEGIRAWPVSDIEKCAADRRRGTVGVAELVPHFTELEVVATVLALQGNRVAWLGLTATDTPVLVLPDGHVVLHDQGLPADEELAIARRHATASAPAAIVRVLPGGEPPAPDIVVLSQAIRRGVRNDVRLRRLAKFSRSPVAAAALKLSVREGTVSPTPAGLALRNWAEGRTSIAGLRGVPGSGRSHQLQLLAAQLAEKALTHGDTPVALIRATGWRPPFQLMAVLREQEHTPTECAALRLAVQTGQCILLVDDVEMPGEPVALAELLAQVKVELATWRGPGSKILLAFSPACHLPGIRMLDLCVPEGPMTDMLREAIEDDMLRVRLKQEILDRGALSLLHTPALARALIDAVAQHQDVSPAHLAVTLANYVRSCCALAALHLPHTTAEQLHLALEQIAAMVWSQGEGVDRDAILLTAIVAELHREFAGHSDATLRRLVDQAILTRTSPGRCVVAEWVMAEALRRTRRPVKPHSPRAASQVRKPDSDNVYFVHNSILEQLLASRIVRQLTAGRTDVLAGPRLSPNICALCRMAEDWPRVAAAILDVLRAHYRPDISENSLLLAVGDGALASSHEHPWQLSGAQLEAMNLQDAQLAGARLERARLADTDLRRAVLDGGGLMGAVLVRADLREASLVEAVADGADLRGAQVDGACLRGASLRGAMLFASESRLSPPDLSGVELAEVDLEATLWRVPLGVPQPIATAMSARLTWVSAASTSHHAVASGEILGPRTFRDVKDAIWTPDGRSIVSLHAGHFGVWSARPLRPRRWWHVGALEADNIALAPDGRWLVSWSQGSSPRVWDMVAEVEATPACLAALRVRSLAWGCGCARLALFASDRSLHVWDAATDSARKVATLTDEEALFRFLPGDVRLLVWSVQTARVERWHVETGQLESSLAVTQSQGGTALAVSRDGQRAVLKMLQHLCILTLDGELAEEQSYTDPEFFSSHATVDWSPDARFIVLAHDDLGPLLWGTESRRWSHHLDQDQHRTSKLRFSPDGTLVLGAGNDTADLFIWDACTGARVESSPTGGSWIGQVALAPDRRSLVACYGATLRGWSLPNVRVAVTQEFMSERAVTLLPNASGIVVGRDRILAIEDLHGLRRFILDRSERNADTVWQYGHFSSDGETFVCTIADNSRQEIAGWNLATGERVHSRTIDRLRDGPVWQCHTLDARRGIVISAGYRHGEAWISLWSAGRTRNISLAKQPSIVQLAVDADRGVLACADGHGVITLWDLQRWLDTGDEQPEAAALRLWTVAVGRPTSDAMLFAPQGGMLAVTVGGVVHLYDGVAGTLVRVLDGHRPRVCSMNFSADGRFLVVGDTSGQVRLWKVATGACVAVVHMSGVHGDVVTRGSHYFRSEGTGTLKGWFLCADRACVPLEMFDGALEDATEIARELAEALDPAG